MPNDHRPLTRGEIRDLSRMIKAGWEPPADVIAETWAGIMAVIRDPLRSPRATMRAARLIYDLHMETAVIESPWEPPADVVKAGQSALLDVATKPHGNDRATVKAFAMLLDIEIVYANESGP